jgi:hypothetical protein
MPVNFAAGKERGDPLLFLFFPAAGTKATKI